MVRAEVAAQPLCLASRASVEPGDDVMCGPAFGVEWHGGLGEAGDGDPGDAARVVEAVRDPAQRLREGIPKPLCVVGGPPGVGGAGGGRGAGPRHGPAAAVEGYRLDVRRAYVGPD